MIGGLDPIPIGMEGSTNIHEGIKQVQVIDTQYIRRKRIMFRVDR